MNVISDELIGEKYINFCHPSGLQVLLLNKKDYSSSYAVFGTRFGSVDNAFEVDGKEIFLPDGVAHFLEHKLFESEERDAFELYSKTGAYANAYTSFDRTCYLFECSSRLTENLKILLDFVQNPYFTAETVKKEQGIIGQEIKMYDDSADWKIMFNLFECLYHYNPVKNEIAGSIYSIAHIDDKMLYNCYNTFYSLSNMFICVVGDFDCDEIIKLIDENIKKPNNKKGILRLVPAEPHEIVKPYIEDYLEVSKPMFMLGYKLEIVEVCSDYYDVKTKICLSLLQEIICGKFSRLYESLYNEGIMTDEFETEVFDTRNTAAVIFSGESDEPEVVRERLIDEIEKIKQNGINERDFEAVKKKYYGNEIAAFDKITTIGSMLVECAVTGAELFAPINIVKDLTVADIMDVARLLDKSKSAFSVIKVKGENI